MSEFKRGDLLRVTRAVSGYQGPNLLRPGQVAWVIVEVVGDYELYVQWLNPTRSPKGCPYLDKSDEFTLANPDDVPEDVLVQVAKIKLLGEL